MHEIDLRGYFWYSETQRKLEEMANEQVRRFNPHVPVTKMRYAIIHGKLTEYTGRTTELPTARNPFPFEDAICLGYGDFACTDTGLAQFLKENPGIQWSEQEWPDEVQVTDWTRMI